ncbi:MAG: RecB family exonuclease [Elusimicrobiota bacterium]
MKVKDLLLKFKEIPGRLYKYFFRPNVTMSNSRLNAYTTCPLKYRYSYEEGLKGFPSSHLHFGSVVHEALEQYHAKFDLKGKQGTFDDLMKEYEEAWDRIKEDMLQQVSGPPLRRWKVALSEAEVSEEDIEQTLSDLTTIYEDEEEEESFRERGVRMLENYFKDNQTNPNDIIALEKPLTITHRGIDILAYLDRIERTPEGEIEVVDYKTGKKTKGEEDIMLGGDTQAMIYTMMVEKKWKQKLKNFYFYYLSNRNRVACNPHDNLIKDTFEDIQETVKNIKYENFDPDPGALCDWCDYQVICEEWKGKMSEYKGIFRKAKNDEGRMGFSYSKMSAFQKCPYNYRKLYVDNVAPKPQPFFAIGHSCHETFEEFFTYPYQPSLKQLRRMFEDNWHSEGYKTREEERENFEKGWQWVKNYYNKYVDGQYIQAYAVEPYFQLPIGDDYVIIGYIDRLQKNPDGTFQILDYKTDPKMRSQEEVDGDLQLTSYYWAMKQFGIDVKSLSLEFLKFTDRIVTTRTDEDIPVFINEVNETISTMVKKQQELEKFKDFPKKKREEKAVELFPPKINKYCGGCDHLIGCPKEQKIRTEYKDKVMNLQEEPMPEPDLDEEESEEDKYGR